jgi:hypothetical protein
MAGMIIESDSKGDLRGVIISVRTWAIRNKFPDWSDIDFDSAFASIDRDLDHLEGKLGTVKAGKLRSMLEQAKAHFEAGHANGPINRDPNVMDDIRLGARLMQDMEYILMDKSPEAYPPELWRWG